jgi:hypothetical protein
VIEKVSRANYRRSDFYRENRKKIVAFYTDEVIQNLPEISIFMPLIEQGIFKLVVMKV